MSAPQPPVHVLIVTLGYEPLAHVSSKRPSRMARELAALGLEVTVLTVDWRPELPPAPRPLDETVGAALAEHGVRVVAIDGRLANPAFDPRYPATVEPPGPRWSLLRRMRTLGGMFRWGSYGRWARLAFEAARHIHRARPIGVAWAIHGDNSCHAVACRLRRELGIPWVADFKDPWSGFFPRYARAAQRWATRRRLRTAAALTETCAAQARDDAAVFGRPVEVVYSGYDAAAMEAAVPERPEGAFSIAYFGSLAPRHDTRVLRGLFERLRQQGTLRSAGLRVHQYTSPRPGQLRDVLAGVVPAETVVEHDWLAQERTFGVMKGTDLLLLLTAPLGFGRVVGLKELEYFASGTPVLHFGEPLEELAPLLGECPQVRVVRTVAEAEAAFAELSSSRHRGRVNAPALAGFTWRAQAPRLAQVLDRAVRASGGG